MQARLRPRNEHEARQLRALGIFDVQKKLRARGAGAGAVMFAATGVTPGDYLAGVRYVKGGAVTNSVVMRSATRTVRFIESHHRFDRVPRYWRLTEMARRSRRLRLDAVEDAVATRHHVDRPKALNALDAGRRCASWHAPSREIRRDAGGAGGGGDRGGREGLLRRCGHRRDGRHGARARGTPTRASGTR